MDLVTHMTTLRERSKQERSAKVSQDTSIRDMPYFYGLISIAISSGLSPQAALAVIADYVPPALAPIVHNVNGDIEAGRSFDDALSTFDDNQHTRSLAHILRESSFSGTSSLGAIDALSVDASNKVRRHAETAMKKLPVTMLFPLVVCILPAFMLLSVVPTLINGFSSISM